MPPSAEHSVRKPDKPFYFNTSESLIRIGTQKANNISELWQGLQTCPDDSIFQHTFRTLQEHHFIQQGFSNDFAHWAYVDCNEVGLAEQLASLDVREFTSISKLRERIVQILEGYLGQNPLAGGRAAR